MALVAEARQKVALRARLAGTVKQVSFCMHVCMYACMRWTSKKYHAVSAQASISGYNLFGDFFPAYSGR
jgi:hypothetical protein